MAKTPNTGDEMGDKVKNDEVEDLDDQGDEASFLASYDASRWPSAAVAVDMVILTIRQGRLSVLLIQRRNHPNKGAWALPGGFCGDETPDEAAKRELYEETSLDLSGDEGHIEQLRTYGAPKRDPRMRVFSIAYLAFLPTVNTPVAGSDAKIARFWDVEDALENIELAFDHREILKDAVERARAKLEYTTLATNFVEEPFTLSDLRRVYESVWGEKLHEANFRRKVLSVPGFVVDTGVKRAARGTPAGLYRKGDAKLLTIPLMRNGN